MPAKPESGHHPQSKPNPYIGLDAADPAITEYFRDPEEVAKEVAHQMEQIRLSRKPGGPATDAHYAEAEARVLADLRRRLAAGYGPPLEKQGFRRVPIDNCLLYRNERGFEIEIPLKQGGHFTLSHARRDRVLKTTRWNDLLALASLL